jgi:N-glycosylase/DNA lyase
LTHQINIPLNYDLDLSSTLDGGQSFDWRSRTGGFWFGLIRKHPVKLSISKTLTGPLLRAEYELEISGKHFDSLNSYLDLDTPYEDVRDRLKTESQLKTIVESVPKFNILKQDPWQTLVSFMLSTQSNIPKIKKNLASLSRSRKNLVSAFGWSFYTFPNPYQLDMMGENQLRNLGLGYRAKNLAQVASLVNRESFSIKTALSMEYKDAKQYLMTLPGVGPKVADCVLAFSMGHKSAFPVDRWVSRGVKRNYPATEKYSDVDISTWGREKFGLDSSYVQQIIFYYERWIHGSDEV